MALQFMGKMSELKEELKKREDASKDKISKLKIIIKYLGGFIEFSWVIFIGLLFVLVTITFACCLHWEVYLCCLGELCNGLQVRVHGF